MAMKLELLLSTETKKVLDLAADLTKDYGLPRIPSEAVVCAACMLEELGEMFEADIQAVMPISLSEPGTPDPTVPSLHLNSAIKKAAQYAIYNESEITVKILIGFIAVTAPPMSALPKHIAEEVNNCARNIIKEQVGARMKKGTDALAHFCEDIKQVHITNFQTPVRRSKEALEIYYGLPTRHVFVIGEPGTGRFTTVIEAIKNIQEPVYILNNLAMQKGTRVHGDVEDRLTDILESVQEQKGILVIRDMVASHESTGYAGRTSKRISTVLLNFIDNKMAPTPIIATITPSEWERMSTDMHSMSYHVVRVDKMSRKDCEKVINNRLVELESTYGVKAEKGIEYNIVEIADRYLGPLPGSAINLLATCMNVIGIDSTGRRRTPLENEFITKTMIYERASFMTQIPMGKITKTEKESLIGLEDALGEHIKAQDDALKAVSQAIRRNRVGLSDTNKPMGSFLFLGPTGVGKTGCARALAEELFADRFHRIDMSEYSEGHSVSRLIGSSPGYVGYGEGGRLVNLLKQTPYCLILLDEIEKAHPNVWNVLLQVFEEGCISDGRGERADATNAVFILTSNAGSHDMANADDQVGFIKKETSDDDLEETAQNALKKIFPPELLNRLDGRIVFKTLPKEVLPSIAEITLRSLAKRAKDRIEIDWDSDVPALIAKKGYSKTEGARPLKRIITDEIESLIVTRTLEGDKFVSIMVEGDEFKVTTN